MINENMMKEMLNDYPDWLSPEAITTLNRGYLLKAGDKLIDGSILPKDETPKEAYLRVANRVEEIYPELKVKDDLFHCLYRGWIGLATPVFTNFGADRGLPISCFLTHLGDSIESIYRHKLTVAQMSKNGGGVATYFGDLRPGGSHISNGGKASSVRNWIKEYDLTASVVTQGNTRRGSIAVYIPIEHPDLLDILRAKDHSAGDPRNFIDCNIAVTISDDFMGRFISGDPEAKELIDKIIEMRVITGSPYIVFIDTVNRANPETYKMLGLEVSMSNLCLTGDTLVVTREGVEPIKNLVGKEVTIYDGKNWVKNDQFFYQGKSPVLEVTLRNGNTIKMTPDHRCLVEVGDRKKVREVKAKDLKINDKLHITDQFRSKGSATIKGAYVKGFLLGDGTSNKNIPLLNLHKPKFMCGDKLLSSLLEIEIDEGLRSDCITTPSFSDEISVEDDRYYGETIFKRLRGLTSRKLTLIDYVTTHRKTLKGTNFLQWDEETRIEFLSGLLDADGTYSSGQIQLGNISESFIDDLQVLINSLGYDASKDSLKYKGRNTIYRISIPRSSAFYLLDELNCQRLKKSDEKEPNRKCNFGGKIVNITISNTLEDVYCTKVPSTSYFTLSSGVLTGNCSEIMLHTSPEYSAVCCLSSMNILRWDEYESWKGKSGFTAVELAIIMLDAVMEEFIMKASKIPGMEPAVNFSLKSRALGLGVQGLTSYYQLHGFPIKSEMTRALNIKIHKSIKEQAVRASEVLGKLYGVPDWCELEERRNSHLLAIAPTRTNSVITGALSPGVEPMEYNYYTAKQNKATFVRVNPHLEKLINARVPLEDRDDVWKSILDKRGSISHLNYLFSDHEREVFKTAREVDQLELIKQAADRQGFICQSQSLNLFSDSELSEDKLYEHIIYAWMTGVKSLYYFKGKSKVSERSHKETHTYEIITKDDCPYCEKIKDILTIEGKVFTEIPLQEAKDKGLWCSEWKTVPQLFIDKKRIGGYDDYFTLSMSNRKETDPIKSEELEGCVSCEG